MRGAAGPIRCDVTASRSPQACPSKLLQALNGATPAENQRPPQTPA